jgi:hypothetical protein
MLDAESLAALINLTKEASVSLFQILAISRHWWIWKAIHSCLAKQAYPPRDTEKWKPLRAYNHPE